MWAGVGQKRAAVEKLGRSNWAAVGKKEREKRKEGGGVGRG
jgi:hypothetical protein